MRVWKNFLDLDGNTYRFRIRHPRQSFASLAGVFAFASVTDFSEWSLLYVRASNDLGELDPGQIELLPEYKEAKALGLTSVLVLITGKATAEYRTKLARLIADAANPPLNPKQAA